MNRNTPVELEFFRAVGQGDLDAIRQMVVADRGLLTVHNYQSFGATPLTIACFGDWQETVELLLDLGADPNQRSDWSMGPWSPLHCAVIRRNHSLAKRLLERGATIDAHTAAGLGNLSALESILARTPEQAREPGGDGCQPLHFAETCEVAELLLQNGADLNARCIDHFSTPVQYLAELRPTVARYLFSRGAQADIFSATLANDLERVHKMSTDNRDAVHARINQDTFPSGPDHNVLNIMTFTVGNNATPLHAAAKANLSEMTRLLVSAGISPNVRGGYDEATPLHLAAWEDRERSAKALIESGANINLRSGNIHNNTPAGWAIVAGSVNVLFCLLDQGAEVMPWFLDDATDALNGRFKAVKKVPVENYRKIIDRLQRS